jgi:hypothetical protein
LNDKRKPYASITIYKPRLSRFVATAILLVLLAGALGGMALREIDGWRTALKVTELQLQERTELLDERTARLQAVESQLEQAERRLRTEPLLWRTLEPAGFSVMPSNNGWQGLLTATVCARGHRYYEGYTHFFSLNRFFVSELALSGNYEYVGKERNGKDRAGRDQYIRYYTHRDALKFNSSTRVSTENFSSDDVQAWRDRLASYCSATFE